MEIDTARGCQITYLHEHSIKSRVWLVNTVSVTHRMAQGLKTRLRAAAPSSVILESFMGPAELADVYRRTRLNFHPSTYDAYGMTIVEAASQVGSGRSTRWQSPFTAQVCGGVSVFRRALRMKTIACMPLTTPCWTAAGPKELALAMFCRGK